MVKGKFTPNPHILVGNTVTIFIPPGKLVEIDARDYALVEPYRWRALRDDNNFYAVSSKRIAPGYKINIRMHRLIMQPKHLDLVDHKDGNGLNNHRINLRVCNHNDNSGNRRKQAGSSQYKGVSWFKPRKTWRAQICVRGVKVGLGYFHDETEAAKAYDQAALATFGEFANINFPGRTV